MTDDVIPLNKIGKIGTVKVYNQAYVDKQQKRIEELEQQIEKMKCCENCKHHCFWGNELNCRTLSYDEELECMKTKNKWELID